MEVEQNQSKTRWSQEKFQRISELEKFKRVSRPAVSYEETDEEQSSLEGRHHSWYYFSYTIFPTF